MKSVLKTITILLVSAVLYLGFLQLQNSYRRSVSKQKQENRAKAEQEKDSESPVSRNHLMFLKLRDPKTNSIPSNARLRELRFSRSLDRANNYRLLNTTRTASTAGYTWKQAGPWNIGGRTRALAIDVNNPDSVIAAGVSGGIWASSNGGNAWSIKTGADQNMSVTYVAQDPRAGHTNTWYYCTGEYTGNSTSGRNYEAFYLGTGIYKSTDNGNTWTRIPSTEPTGGGAPVEWVSPYQVVSKLVVSPTTGSVFISCNAYGILKMPANGTSFSKSLVGNSNDYRYCQIAVNKNGWLLASLSENGKSDSNKKPGIYISTDDGANWTNITPSNFPSAYSRTVMAFSPSNPNIAYTFTYNGTTGNPVVSGGYGQDDVTFYKFTFNSDGSVNSAVDRSANMPNYKGAVGELNTQNNYNMVLAVKPDDPNFVILGATNLYRSTDGFATTGNTTWIGGYDPSNNVSLYPNQHCDEHIAVFNPSKPNELYVGSDGGVSYTANVTTNITSTHPVTWFSKNTGYVTTQYYAISIAQASGDNRILGGMQDNGSPFYRISNLSNAYPATDVSSGDGGYAYLGATKAYASVENGNVYRYSYNTSGNITQPEANVTPPNINYAFNFSAFKVDPSDESYMYYPAGDTLWRNSAIDQPTYSSAWNIVAGIKPPQGYSITALGVSTSNPQHTLYVGTSDLSAGGTGVPRLYMYNGNATTARYPSDSTYTGFPSGAYLNDIAVNPDNGNEIMVVFSNYEVSSLYYSKDGGGTYSQVEGNLNVSGVNYNNVPTDLGPSVRSAAIVPTSTGTYYFAGTSTGLYMTQTLDGSNTVWVKQDGSQGGIGDAVVTDLASRTSDSELAVATHGRGAFVGSYSTDTAINQPTPNVPYKFKLAQNYPNPFNPSTKIAYTLPSEARVTLTIYDVTGRKVAQLLSSAIKSSGSHMYTFDASKLASGMYLYRIQVAPMSSGGKTYSMTKKMILLK